MPQALARATSTPDSEADSGRTSRFCIAVASRVEAALAARRLAHLPVRLRVTCPAGGVRVLHVAGRGAGHAEGVDACKTRCQYLLVVNTAARAIDALVRKGGQAPARRTQIAILVRTAFADMDAPAERATLLALTDQGVKAQA